MTKILQNLHSGRKVITQIELEPWKPEIIDQKLNYIHYNPVEAGIVTRPEDYLYSSAGDYAGEKGMVNVILI